MAPGTSSTRPLAAAQSESAVKVADLRTAVLHLIELAAAYEKRGKEFALRRGDHADIVGHAGLEPVDAEERSNRTRSA